MFCFFSDIDLLASQTSSEAFGVVDATSFRVSSIHHAVGTAAPNAYAVCAGEVLIQDAGSGLVNLVLKPSEQPPFAFPRIKFFIYRGIVKTSLVAGNQVAPASSSNDLTTAIWDAQTKRNAREQTATPASSKALGIDVTGNGSIDEVFYQTNQPHQLQRVQAGWSLGTFSASPFAFEIVADAAGYDPPLSMARLASNTIQVAPPPSGATPAQSLQYETAKEEILNYIDPCAFFGGFIRQNIQVKASGGSFIAKPPYGVYDSVLKGAHLTAPADGVFYSRSTTYLDIRNEFAHTLNYFGNYGRNVSIAFGTQGALSAPDYYASGWPLMTIDNASLPAGVSSSRIVLRLSLLGGDNPLPTVYLSSGYLNSEFPREPKQGGRLVDLTVLSGQTTEVALAIPNRGGTTATTAISSYIRLKYFKRFDVTAAAAPQSSGTVIRARNFLDNVFAPFDFKIPFSGPAKIKSMIYDSEVFIDMSRSGGFDEIAGVGVLDNGPTYTFIFHPKITRPSNLRVTTLTPFCGETSKRTADPWVHIAKQLPGHVAQQSTFQMGNQPAIPYVTITDDGSESDEPYLGAMLITCDKAKLLATDRSGFAAWSPLYLGAHNMVRYADTLGREYWNFNISVIGFDDSSSATVKEVVTDITIYLYGDITRQDVVFVGTDGLLTFQSTSQVIPATPPIKHIFVLMLENRSFDHMLGYSGLTGTDAETGASTSIDGPLPVDSNVDGAGMPHPPKETADFTIPPGDYGPPHEFLDVLRQLNTTNTGAGLVSPGHLDNGVYPEPNNEGFIFSYATGSLMHGEEKASGDPANIMNCFAKDQVPVITRLAGEFAVCDRWFSSLPGPTWPNRFFVHAATSGGLDDSPKTWAVISTAGLPIRGFKFENSHIYDRIAERGNAFWRVYEDSSSQSVALSGMTWWRTLHNYRHIRHFADDLTSADYRPLYTFIEPHYGDTPIHVGPLQQEGYLHGSSQHPRDDVRPGECLIKFVYEAIRNSSHWQNSVLIITYDEHGGFYDHQDPPEATPPGDDQERYPPVWGFKFDRYGPRVPAVIVSPLIEKGVIDHTQYDHSSILATIERMFRLRPLTDRDGKAEDFRHLFTRTIARMSDTEAPTSLDFPPDSYPGAAGPPTFKCVARDIALPTYTVPGTPAPISWPNRTPDLPPSEDDLPRMLEDNNWKLPLDIIGDDSIDLLAWLHVAFRRLLGTRRVLDSNWRKDILSKYCAVKTVQDAADFIQLSITVGDQFRDDSDAAEPTGGFLA